MRRRTEARKPATAIRNDAGERSSATQAWQPSGARNITIHQNLDYRTVKGSILVPILAAFLTAFVFSVGGAWADGNSASSGGHLVQACGDFSRVNGWCLQSGYDNSPPVSSGVIAGSTWWVRNRCSDYGTVVANIDIKGATDSHVHLDGSGRVTGKRPFTDVRAIKCCLDRSDLCWKSQVIKREEGQDNAGHIRYAVATSGTASHGWYDVSTHRKRWEFCQDHQDYIYCRLDPDGDAFTDPGPTEEEQEDAEIADGLRAAASSTACDGSPCTIRDCAYAFAESDAGDTCSGLSGENRRFCSSLAGAGCTNDSLLDGTICASDRVLFALACLQANLTRAHEMMHSSTIGDFDTDITLEEVSEMKLCVFKYTAGERDHYRTSVLTNCHEELNNRWTWLQYSEMQNNNGVDWSTVPIDD